MVTTRLFVGLAAAGIALAGCERESSKTTTTPRNTTITQPPAPARPAQPSSGVDQVRPDVTKAPDNTGQNRPDRRPESVTPEDQSNAPEDVELTAAIRRAVMADDALSVNAKNAKIIADKNGMVTLRGVVESQAEKDALESKAMSVAGVKNVRNLLDVKGP